MGNDILAVIPARGGSKRIPRKNVRPFCGRPLICWTIETALVSSHLSDIVVNTDDDEIQSIAEEMGVTVYRRPPELGEDHVMTDQVLSEMGVSMFGDAIPYEAIVLLEPTSPARRSGLLDDCVDEWADGLCDALVSVSPMPEYWWCSRMEDGVLIPMNPEEYLLRSNDLPPVYFLNGSMYVLPPSSLLPPSTRLWSRGWRIIPHIEMDVPALDIDDERSWKMGEAIMREYVLPGWVTQ